jgi:hypothetical protein
MTEPTATETSLDVNAHLAELRRQAALEQRRHPTIYSNCDLIAELRRFWRLPAMQQKPRSPLPALRVRYSSVHFGARYVSGHASCRRHRIVLTVGYGASLSRVLESLLHEAVHISLPGECHSVRFILRLVRAVAEAWSIDIPRPLDTTERGRHSRLAYAVDERIEVELERVFAAGCFLPPHAEPPPPAPVPSRAERADRLRRQRHEHALEMLKRTERRLKIAQRRARCWREKVRYYEKIAAKRGGAT